MIVSVDYDEMAYIGAKIGVIGQEMDFTQNHTAHTDVGYADLRSAIGAFELSGSDALGRLRSRIFDVGDATNMLVRFLQASDEDSRAAFRALVQEIGGAGA